MTEIEADQTVRLSDFAFTAPVQISAGEQTWLIENKGEQPHEMLLSRVDEETTVGTLMQNMAGPPSEDFRPHASSWAPISPGARAWVTLDLEPGVYLLRCFLPDIRGGGQLHSHLGMVRLITVTE